MIKGKQNPRNTFCFKVTHIAETAPGTAVTESRCGGPRDGQMLRIRAPIPVVAFLVNPKGIQA